MKQQNENEEPQRHIMPCPFCGGQPEFTERFNQTGMWGMIHRCRVIGPISWDWHDINSQITRWNTRAK